MSGSVAAPVFVQMVPGLGAWSSDTERRLTNSGRFNHWIHARYAQLELCLLRLYMQEHGREDEDLPEGTEAEQIVKRMMPEFADAMTADGQLSPALRRTQSQLARSSLMSVCRCLFLCCTVQTRRS